MMDYMNSLALDPRNQASKYLKKNIRNHDKKEQNNPKNDTSPFQYFVNKVKGIFKRKKKEEKIKSVHKKQKTLKDPKYTNKSHR